MNIKKLRKLFISNKFSSVIELVSHSKLESLNADQLLIIGASYAKLGKLQKAELPLIRANKKRPGKPEIINNLSEVKRQLGKGREALALWERASKEAKEEFSENYALALLENGLIDEARIVLEKRFHSTNVTPTIFEILVESCLQAPNIYEFGMDELLNHPKVSTSKTLTMKTVQIIHELISLRKKPLLKSIEIMGMDEVAQNFRLLNSKEKTFVAAYCRFCGLLSGSLDFTPHNGKGIFHIGDSHCLSFNNTPYEGITQGIVKPMIVFGLKSYHLALKDTNKYQFYVKNNFQRLPENATILFSCGEIDCRENEGFLKNTTKINIRESIDFVASGYLDFVVGAKKVNQKLNIMGVHRPAQQAKEDNHSYEERVRLIINFNDKLRELSKQRAVRYIDTFKSLNKNAEMNLIDNRHLHPRCFKEIENQISA